MESANATDVGFKSGNLKTHAKKCQIEVRARPGGWKRAACPRTSGFPVWRIPLTTMQGHRPFEGKKQHLFSRNWPHVKKPGPGRCIRRQRPAMHKIPGASIGLFRSTFAISPGIAPLGFVSDMQREWQARGFPMLPFNAGPIKG